MTPCVPNIKKLLKKGLPTYVFSKDATLFIAVFETDVMHVFARKLKITKIFIPCAKPAAVA
jgi:hypothetical protein